MIARGFAAPRRRQPCQPGCVPVVWGLPQPRRVRQSGRMTPNQPVTVAVTRIVDPANAKEVAAWARAGQDLLSSFPGYLGNGWIRPDPESREWHMLFRFASADDLAAWERSRERAWWMASAVGIVEHTPAQKLTGIEGWFDTPERVESAGAATPPPTPPRWKQMVSIFLVFYPLSLLANWLLSFVAGDWPLPVRVLVAVLGVTPVMTYLAMPFVTRALRPWLMAGR